MRGTKTRRLVLLPFGVVAGVLVFASVAYACVTFQGKFQVTGAGGTSTAFGSGYHPYQGDNPSIEHCRPSHGAPEASASANTITVTWAKYDGCHWTDTNVALSRNDGGFLDEGTYVVRFDPRQSFCARHDPDCPDEDAPKTGAWRSTAGWFRLQPDSPQCYWGNPGDPVVDLGTMQVNEDGFGQATFEIPSSALTGPTEAAGVCTRELGTTPEQRGHPGPPHSNMAPVVVI